MYADTAAGRAEATPGADGTCPACRHPVRPRCGSIVVHHWAHYARTDCDRWSEPESQWHRGWKLAVPPERREVVIGPHGADVVTASGGVVELQHSPISPQVIDDREGFYGPRMAWIFDATAAYAAGRISVGHGDGAWDRLRWRYARRSAGVCRRTVLLDIGEDVVLHLNGLSRCRQLTRASVEAWMRDGGRWQVRRVPAPAPPRRAEPPAGSILARLAKAGRWREGTPAMQARREHSARLIAAMARWRATGRPEDWAAYVALARHAARYRPPGRVNRSTRGCASTRPGTRDAQVSAWAWFSTGCPAPPPSRTS